MSPTDPTLEASEPDNEELLAYMSRAFNVSRQEDDDQVDDDDDRAQGTEEDDSESDDPDESKSSAGYSISTGDVRSSVDQSEDDHDKILDEGEIVRSSKVLIFFAIMTVAMLGAATVTYFVKKAQNDVLRDHFEGFSYAVAIKTHENLQKVLKSTQSLSRTITTSAIAADQTFPFVTLPHFEVYGGEAREAANAQLVALAPRVTTAQLELWGAYSQSHQEWITKGLVHENSNVTNPGLIPGVIHIRGGKAISKGPNTTADSLPESHYPLWQMAFAPRNASLVNLDLVSDADYWNTDIILSRQTRRPLISSVHKLNYLSNAVQDPHPDVSSNKTLPMEILNPLGLKLQPTQFYIIHPVFQRIDDYFVLGSDTVADDTVVSTRSISFENSSSTTVVASVIAIMDWSSMLTGILPAGIHGLHIVVNDGCGRSMTFEANGSNAIYLGEGDQHDTSYNSYLMVVTDLTNPMENSFKLVEVDGDNNATEFEQLACKYSLEIYPSAAFENIYNADKTATPAIVIIIMIVLITAVLCIYDYVITNRQRQLLAVANQTHKLISSLFPKAIQKRIFEDAANAVREQRALQRSDYEDVLGESSHAQLESIKYGSKKKAIADYFPNATIFFGDLVGFTAWSSTREPTQVFELLETLYHAFDEIARRRKVFKVETVGDCYVAATGLPEQRSDHAVVMARFARDCMLKFRVLVKEMEEILGPDTGDLGLRVGINSGPVTAGVLRGDRSRFQLFGDTVNTAARMESTGLPNKIHISKETADLLIEAGKGRWLSARLDKVYAKGKGELQTFWLGSGGSSSVDGSMHESRMDELSEGHSGEMVVEQTEESVVSGFSDKMHRLVKWNTDLLVRSLQIVIAHRVDVGTMADSIDEMRALENASRTDARNGQHVCEEVVEVINLPPKRHMLDPNDDPTDPESVQLSPEVLSQLTDFVRTIAVMYRESNPFHNFEHASHVTMSTSKLMARIVAPSDTDSNAHDNTYGITSDPLTQFAALFAALIHDVDHPGVPNSTLVKEGSVLATTYKFKCVAEQNSFDLAWDLFMDFTYEDLRRVLYVSKEEFKRFRQLVCNMVMATDIMDKELGAFRKARWDKAFAIENATARLERSLKQCLLTSDINRKATIVLEHLIQASDVSHTMQHWHIYSKWNERFFQECYRAYREGRADSDPSENWYKGELGFFDFYIIPLAKKLESCGVFGVSSDEYLAYAMNNRNEWEQKGQERVAAYLENYRRLEGEAGYDES